MPADQELEAAQKQAADAAQAAEQKAESAAEAAQRQADARAQAAEQRCEAAVAAAHAEASAASERVKQLEAETATLRAELAEAARKAAQAPLENGNVSNGHADGEAQAAELAAAREVKVCGMQRSPTAVVVAVVLAQRICCVINLATLI